jgi:hypothetical protein
MNFNPEKFKLAVSFIFKSYFSKIVYLHKSKTQNSYKNE